MTQPRPGVPGSVIVTFVTIMYNRLFTKILDSSIWLESDATRIVWITLLAAMDEDGFAAFSCNDNLARRANVPMDALELALSTLESPDKYNPNDEFEGRRIERVPNGWLVLKAPYYRSLLSREIAREQNRLRVQKHREKTHVTKKTLQNVTDVTCNTLSASVHASASFWEELKRNPLYQGIEVDRELEKARQWCKRKNRRLTQRFFENWLGKADREFEVPKREPRNSTGEAKWI